MDESNSTQPVQCAICAKHMEKRELEPHICSEHLDYFPYSCGHCGHYMTTADMVRFHATRKAHLPLRIREIPNIKKEHELDEALKQSLAGMIKHPPSVGNNAAGNSPVSQQSDDSSKSSLTHKLHSEDAETAAVTVSPTLKKEFNVAEKSHCEEKEKKDEETKEVAVKTEVKGAEDVNDEEDSEKKDEGPARRSQRIASMPPGSGMFANEDLVWKLMVQDSEDDKTVPKATQKQTQSAEMDEPKPSIPTVPAPPSCLICKLQVPLSQRSMHVKSHIETEAPWTCTLCGFIGKTVASVKIHINKKHGACIGIPEAEQFSQIQVPIDTMNLMCFGMMELTAPDDDTSLSTTNGELAKGTSQNSTGDFLNKLCNICDASIDLADIPQHIQFHLESRPMFGCAYCDFKAKRKGSVQAHITWKHEEGSRNIGIQDLSSAISGYDQMHSICFDISDSKSDDDAAKLLQAPEDAKMPSGQNRGLLHQLTSKAGEFRKAHKQIRRNENATKHLTCSLCSRKVRKQMVAAHIYINHIQKTDTLKCSYCGFGVAYNSYRMKVHMKQKHPQLDPNAYTSSCNEMMEVYLSWRKDCFPEIGKFHLRDFSKTRKGSAEQGEGQEMDWLADQEKPNCDEDEGALDLSSLCDVTVPVSAIIPPLD